MSTANPGVGAGNGPLPAADRAWLYEYPVRQRRWLAGNTLCYRRGFWEQNRFPEIQVGEDTCFVWSPQARNAALTPESDFYVGLIHAENTSPKSPQGSYWRPQPLEHVHRLLGQDLAFYTESVPHESHKLRRATGRVCRDNAGRTFFAVR